MHFGHDDLTNREIAALLHWPINSVTPRVYELRKMGLVEFARKRECRVTRKKVIAWRRRVVSSRKEDPAATGQLSLM